MDKNKELKIRGVRLDDEHHMLLNYLKGSRGLTQSEILHAALKAYATEEELHIADRIYKTYMERESEAQEKEK